MSRKPQPQHQHMQQRRTNNYPQRLYQPNVYGSATSLLNQPCGPPVKYNNNDKLSSFYQGNNNYGGMNISGSTMSLASASSNVSNQSNLSQIRDYSNYEHTHFDYKLYTCPGCLQSYDYQRHGPLIQGRVPLVLGCKHTNCEECVLLSFRRNYSKVQCASCNAEFPHVAGRAFQSTFDFNHYIMGYITCFKEKVFGGKERTLGRALVPTNIGLKKNNLAIEAPMKKGVKKEKCGLCATKEGTLHCEDCGGTYCDECCTNLHKSGKSLKSHQINPVGAFSVKLRRCTDHTLEIEFFCEDCETEVCCYCFLDKHEGHQRSYLAKLDEAEKNRLSELRKTLPGKLMKLQESLRKVSKIDDNKPTNVEISIGQYFADLHARLFYIEKKLRDEVACIKSDSQGIGKIHSSLEDKVEELSYLLQVAGQADEAKFNKKALLKKLIEYENIPCHLINGAGDDKATIRLKVDETLEHIEDYFTICYDDQASKYVLVPVDDTENNTDECSNSGNEDFSTNRKPKDKKKHRKSSKSKISLRPKSAASNVAENNRLVYVSHINSLNSFYVQLKSKYEEELEDFKRNINTTVQNGVANVSEVEIGKLYLATFDLTNKGKFWCRVRAVSELLVEGEVKYRVHFIDYGHSRVVSDKELRLIPIPSIYSKTPFAIHCKLYNPSDSVWVKNAHLQLAKIIKGKELVLIIKSQKNDIWEVELNIFTAIGELTSVTDILVMAMSALSSSDISSLKSDDDSYRAADVTPTSPQPAGSGSIFNNSIIFKKGQSHDVYIRYVLDPHNIYIQKVTYQDSLDHLIANLGLYYNTSKSDVVLPQTGTDLVVQYKSKNFGKWHRARVQEVFISKKLATVFLVDWGKRITVPWGSMRLLADSFKKVEAIAVSIKLADIEPVVPRGWGTGAIEFFNKFMCEKKWVKFLVNEVDPLDGVLFDVLANYDICINTLLVEEEHAISSGKLSSTLKWMHPDSKDKNDTADSSGTIFDTLNKLSLHEDEEETKIESDEDESDREDKGIKQRVEIIRFESPDLIYIKFLSSKQVEEKLCSEIQIHYNEEKVRVEEISVGDRCVTYDSSTKHYCRSIIKGRDGDKYKVYLSDKGHEIITDISNIYQFHKYFARFANIIYKCHLADIKPAGAGGKWSLLAIEWFDAVFKKHSDLYVRKVSDDKTRKSLPVKMWYSKVIEGNALEPRHTKFILLNQKIVKVGLAFRTTPAFTTPQKSKVVVPTDTSSDSDGEISSLNDSELEKNVPNDSQLEKNVPQTDDVDSEEESKSQPVQILEHNILDWRPPLPLKRREFFAYITTAESGGHLFIREETLQPVYEEMERELKEAFDSNPGHNKSIWHVNELCTIKYNDFYYRGRVLDVISKAKAKVFMVDFASDHILDTKNLFTEIMYPDLPVFTTKIKLYNIYSQHSSWLTSDYETLLKSVEEYSKIIIRGALNLEIPYADVYNTDNVCLNDLMLQLCPNLTCSKTPNKYEEDLDAEEDCIIETIEDEDAPVENGAESPILGDFLRYKPIPLPEVSSPEDKVEMDIVHVMDYCTVTLDVLNHKTYEPGTFAELMTEIQGEIDNLPTLQNIAVGQPCIAQYMLDKIYYRAQIINISNVSCGYVTIFYVDYGNTEIMSVKNLKEVKIKWLEYPVRHHLAVVDFKLTKDEYKDLLLAHMNETLKVAGLLIQFTQKEPLKIHIYKHAKEEEPVLFYQDFIDNKYITIPQN